MHPGYRFVPWVAPTHAVSMCLLKRLSTAWLAGLLAAAIVPVQPARAQVHSRTVAVSPGNRPVTRDTTSTIRNPPFAAAAAEVLRLTNVERAAAGCPPLVAHDSLTAAAMAHSLDMATRRAIGHTGSDGRSASQRARDVGYVYRRIAENVAAGQPDAPGSG